MPFFPKSFFDSDYGLFNVKIGLFFVEFQIKSFGVFDGLVIFPDFMTEIPT